MKAVHHYTGNVLLLQQHRRSAQEGDPSPVPDHNDEDAGCEKSLHGKPYLSKASVLMDALVQEGNTINVNYLCCVCHFIGKQGLKLLTTTNGCLSLSQLKTGH